jgi:hypothetical protein
MCSELTGRHRTALARPYLCPDIRVRGSWALPANPGLIRKAAESELKSRMEEKKRGIGKTGLVGTENAAAC